MRKLIIIGLTLILTQSSIVAQQMIADTTYQQLKMNGQLNGNVHYTVVNTGGIPMHHVNSPGTAKASNCACYTPHDGTWTLAMAPNDDDSYPVGPAMAIPFNFCLYGNIYNSLWINNNGNVTFDVAYGTYSAVGFPSAAYVMVAPFWADVDTRGIGEVWYKITPTAVYVNWENVGYFSSQTDKTNTFSLIISDGNDPVIGVGNNVAFCYQDMQWTTGSASSGVGGFGGIAATVGCNRGDGVSFVQFGRFDSPGTAYFGPYATNNGVSWLDNQSFIFNACNSTNIAPVVSNGFGQCDTIRLCQGDTLLQTVDILSPEAGQITVVNATCPSSNFTLIDTTSGNSAQVTFQIIGTTPGIFTVTINAVDNGVPVQNVNFSVVVEVTPNTVPDPVITGDTLICPGSLASLSVDSIYDTYSWNTGSTNDSITTGSSGIYSILVTLNGCKQRDSITVTTTPSPSCDIIDSVGCNGIVVNFNSTSNDTTIVSYAWTFSGGATPASSNLATPDVTFPTAGFYPVDLTITNALGCTTTVSQNFNVLIGLNPDFGVYPICISRFTFDPNGAGLETWTVNWKMGDGTIIYGSGPPQDTAIFNYIYANPGTYNATMIATNPYGCVDSITKPVVVLDTLSVIMPNVLVQSSAIGNNKVDMEVIKPSLNLCVDYTYTVFDRWGVKVYVAKNDPYFPDLYCSDCFKGKSSNGQTLVPGVYYWVLEGNYHIQGHGFITIFD